MTVYEQIQDFCECQEGTYTESDIDELIDLISMATCWTQTPCETFLSSARTESVDLPDCLDECQVFEFRPYYRPFSVESFDFKLVKYEGIEEDLIDITEYSYSEVDGLFRLKLPVPSCKCRPCVCGCEPEYRLLVRYTAGYEELPDCLLPLFCEALQYVSEKNACDCSDCAVCAAGGGNDMQPVIEYEDGANITDRLQYYFVSLLSEQYKRQLGLISLCGECYGLWGEVV